MFNNRTTFDLGDPYGEIAITEALNADTSTVQYHVTGPRIDGPILVSPNPHDQEIIPATVRVLFGEDSRRHAANRRPLHVDGLSVAGAIVVDPRNVREIPDVRRQDDVAPVSVHPVPDEVQDHVAVVVGLLVDRWVRRSDSPAMRLTVMCQNLAMRRQQEVDYYQRAGHQLTALCGDLQARAERLDLLEQLAQQHAQRK